MGLLDRFRRRTDGAASSPARPEVVSSVDDDEIRQAALERVLPGFLTLPEVVEIVGDDLEIGGDPRVAHIVDEVWARRLAEESTWEGRGGYDRVATAFAALDVEGVVARMAFTCCQTCGTAEIDDERTPVAAAEGDYGFREWGYTFFHEQDAERLADEPATLYLSYSTFTPAPGLDPALLDRWRAGDESVREHVVVESDRAVGQRVSDALREQGLTVDWDGSTGRRIAVEVPSWRKPLPR